MCTKPYRPESRERGSLGNRYRCFWGNYVRQRDIEIVLREMAEQASECRIKKKATVAWFTWGIKGRGLVVDTGSAKLTWRIALRCYRSGSRAGTFVRNTGEGAGTWRCGIPDLSKKVSLTYFTIRRYWSKAEKEERLQDGDWYGPRPRIHRLKRERAGRWFAARGG